MNRRLAHYAAERRQTAEAGACSIARRFFGHQRLTLRPRTTSMMLSRVHSRHLLERIEDKAIRLGSNKATSQRGSGLLSGIPMRGQEVYRYELVPVEIRSAIPMRGQE